MCQKVEKVPQVMYDFLVSSGYKDEVILEQLKEEIPAFENLMELCEQYNHDLTWDVNFCYSVNMAMGNIYPLPYVTEDMLETFLNKYLDIYLSFFGMSSSQIKQIQGKIVSKIRV